MNQPELSIIIPVHNAYQYFENCIKSLFKIQDITYEIVIVNDASTDQNVINFLETLPNIQVVHNPVNQGFLKSCKAGALEATGKYLLFLNSDTELIEPKSFRYMIDVLEKKKNIGIVGAKLLLANGTIQHAGLKFDRGSMNFQHRYYGTDYKDPRVLTSEVVEAVTGAVFLVRKNLWKQLKGFDEIYTPSYFEDTDFCMRAKQKGIFTYYCAEAVFNHYQSKSHGGGLKPEQFNKNHEIFKQRWIRTGIVCEYPKITACYIVFNEAEYIKYSVKSIYDFVDNIIIVEGSSEAVRQYAHEDGSSTDGTVLIIESMEDPDNKIKLIQGKWKDKTEQRNVYCQLLDDTDYAFIIDGDEVWDKFNLNKIEQMIFSRPDIPALQFNFKDFWKDFRHISKGVWGQFTGRKSLINLTLTGNIKYDLHTLPVMENGGNINSVYINDIYFFHYSYLRNDKKMKQKIQYYLDTPSDYYEVK